MRSSKIRRIGLCCRCTSWTPEAEWSLKRLHAARRNIDYDIYFNILSISTIEGYSAKADNSDTIFNTADYYTFISTPTQALMSFRSGMRPFSRKQTSKKASKQASIQQLLLRGAQRRAEQQLAKEKIRKALVEVKTKYSVEMRCEKEVEVIEILSSSDDEARNVGETQENVPQRQEAIH